ncbi:VCBS repeat-containing protein [Phaeobacter sp. QD34_3]|uniref:FG-GAP repeat domain-containing protein n=1 Tax=unclassified Phaeobacter TaxID=2621772 RepID=UPI00237EF3FA|nr:MULTISPECIES: VCBS repeat-containing protein [unclassified Phaeobacter]MDE4131852.1 VCBS repeat-containing protein [Phaeobacter sp. QD34_3]MDE4135490.1 VCBS repeat-containing protein [Phaeobacter sp. QD34_24]MDE4173479.1 VCBS repeat-containing protein [Phaeobacter sp. PT47_59]
MALRGQGARRRPTAFWPRSLRRAAQAMCLWLAVPGAPVEAQTDAQDRSRAAVALTEASFYGPTTRYAHAVLGDAVEWTGLSLRLSGSDGAIRQFKIDLPVDHVFEDLAPRPVDLDLDGRPDAAMVVETDMGLGAALALYGAEGKIAETPHIGQRNRWLAPIGAADLDGDGYVELAYIDRPHLAKTLRIWRFKDGALEAVASLAGLTNHRIGQDFITSGIRDCGEGVELVTVDANWSRVMATRLTASGIKTRAIGGFVDSSSVTRALNCA